MADRIRAAAARERLARLAGTHGWAHDSQTRVNERFAIAWSGANDDAAAPWMYQELRARVVQRLTALGRAPHVGVGFAATAARQVWSAPAVVDVSLPNAGSLVFFGQRRTTVLAPDDGTATTYDEPGHHTVENEMLARRGSRPELVSPIQKADLSAGLIVTTLLDGFNLAVRGPTRSNLGRVADLHRAWQGQVAQLAESRPLSAIEYLALIEAELGDRVNDPLWAALRDHARRTSRPIHRAPSHGDLQLANVIEEPRGALRLIDFEHFNYRWEGFDAAELASRYRTPTSLDRESRLWLAVERYRRAVHASPTVSV